MLALLGLDARQGQCKGDQCQGSGLLLLPSQPSKPCSYAKKLVCVCVLCTTWAGTGCCDTMPGASGQLFVRKKRASPQLPNYAAR